MGDGCGLAVCASPFDEAVVLGQLLVAAGLWFAMDWARLACGAFGVPIACWYTTTFLAGNDPWRALRGWPGLIPNAVAAILTAVLACVAIYCLLPSTGRLFARARAAKAQ